MRHWSSRCVSNNYRTQAKASVANVATEMSGNETGHKCKQEFHAQNCGRTSGKSLKGIKIKTSSRNNFQRVTRIPLMSTRATQRKCLFLCVDVELMQLLGLIVRTCVTVFWVFLLPDRRKEAGTMAPGPAHLLPILPQSANPQQVSERRL